MQNQLLTIQIYLIRRDKISLVHKKILRLRFPGAKSFYASSRTISQFARNKKNKIRKDINGKENPALRPSLHHTEVSGINGIERRPGLFELPDY